MSRSIRRKYRGIRHSFKRDMINVAKDNKAFAMMIVSTYSARMHRTHIGKVWELLGIHHPEAYRDYNDKIGGQMLAGTDDFFKSLYFADRELYKKYFSVIPECFAMGDALAIAYGVLKE